MSFATINLCVASEPLIPKVSVYFVIDSVRKDLNAPTYSLNCVLIAANCAVLD
jgi:hypothetical protein